MLLLLAVHDVADGSICPLLLLLYAVAQLSSSAMAVFHVLVHAGCLQLQHTLLHPMPSL
jgi:hypothetical protein